MTTLLLEALAAIGPYGWFVAGACLLIAETLLPGVSLMWFGVAATLVGLIRSLAAVTWETQVLAFVGLSAMTVIFGRLIAARRAGDGADRVNRGAEALIGREVVLAEPILHGAGRATLGDSLWRVTGPDMPAGATVRITGAESSTLRVEPCRS